MTWHLHDVHFCKDQRNKIEVPDPLAVGDLISSKLNNKRKLARLITQYRHIFFPVFRKARPSFFRVLQRKKIEKKELDLLKIHPGKRIGTFNIHFVVRTPKQDCMPNLKLNETYLEVEV